MSRLKVAYFGDGPWSHRTLIELAANQRDFEILFVTPRFDTQDQELCRLAKERGLEVRVIENVNSENTIKDLRAFEIDVAVSMSFNQIFRELFLSLPRLGTINCHAGALPRYRGRNVLNWALINGETSFGVTAHFVDTGIDTGDILHQEIVPIKQGDNYGDLLELAYEACPRVLITALQKLRNNIAFPQPQDELGDGFYCGRRSTGDEWINWSWSAERIVNFVRAIAPPGPGALTALGNQIIAVYSASFDPASPSYLCTEGEIVSREAAGVWVKASDKVVRLEYCRQLGDDECFVPKWLIGTRLANKIEYRLAKLETDVLNKGC